MSKMKGSTPEALPPPPAIVPLNFIPSKVPNRTPMARRQFGTRGQKIPLLTNHFRVQLERTEDYFYQYSVALFYDDENQTPVEAKGVGRRVLDMVQTIYGSDLGGKGFAYDGEKTLFTVGPLDRTILEFTVLLENLSSNRTVRGGSPGHDDDPKRSRRPPQSKSYNVKISYATRIPIKAIFDALQGHESEQFNEAVRVLDVLLRQHAAKQGCLLVRQCFFHNDPKNSISIGGGVVGCRGFHSSFRATQAGLSLNMDVSTTMIVKPGKVIDFLLENQNVRDIRDIDWIKAKRMLKSLRIKTFPSNLEYKIIGLSERSCMDQKFTMKQKSGSSPGDPFETTVYDYYLKRGTELKESRNFPCLDVGKPKRPVYIPLEFCELISLQRYTKSLSNLQRASLVEKSRQKPRDRMHTLMDALHKSNYAADPMINSTGLKISSTFTEVQGRVLEPPKLKFGSGGDLLPRNGRWNYNNKTLVEPTQISCWAIVNFSARCDIKNMCKDLLRCSGAKGMSLEEPYAVIEENYQDRRCPAPVRVEKMFEAIKKTLPGPPLFLLCLLPERKNSDIYGPWKRKCLVDFGIVTQCIAPSKVNDQYLTNLVLKINSKMGGINSLLSVECLHSIPLVSKIPTIIFGMDVSHGSPGRSDVPSIAAVVSSRQWPLISRYRASVRAQSARVEMIDGLFKKVSADKDEGMIRELLYDFYTSTSRQMKPQHIVIFRDGVSESQFSQVLNIELEQIMQACKFFDDTWDPKFTMIVAQKTHHTKFFQERSEANVPPGTIIDNRVCDPKNNDFYLCAQNGPIGTTRPTHYHVLLDQIGFSADDLQELVHSLSYVYQRSTTAISVVAPICYAHLAAQQMSQFVKYDDMSDVASSHSGGAGGSSTGGGAGFIQIPKLHEKVCRSMFFC